MPYKIECRNCKKASYAGTIVDLITMHLDTDFMLKCVICGSKEAHIYLSSNTQNDDGKWERWVKGVYHYGSNDYHPYAFLISHTGPNSKIDAIQISYFKDYRESGGRLKHGHGPGGTPVIDIKDFKKIGDKLTSLELI